MTADVQIGNYAERWQSTAETLGREEVKRDFIFFWFNFLSANPTTRKL